jgi:hypothetical protein
VLIPVCTCRFEQVVRRAARRGKSLEKFKILATSLLTGEKPDPILATTALSGAAPDARRATSNPICC